MQSAALRSHLDDAGDVVAAEAEAGDLGVELHGAPQSALGVLGHGVRLVEDDELVGRARVPRHGRAHRLWEGRRFAVKQPPEAAYVMRESHLPPRQATTRTWEANALTLSRTTAMPRSSEAFSSSTRVFISSGPYISLAMARAAGRNEGPEIGAWPPRTWQGAAVLARAAAAAPSPPVEVFPVPGGP